MGYILWETRLWYLYSYRKEGTGDFWLSVAIIKIMTQNNTGGKSLFNLIVKAHHMGKPGQEFKAGAWRQKQSRGNKGMLLTCLFLAFVQLPTGLRILLPKTGWALTYKLATKKIPPDMTTDHSDEGSSSVEVPSFLVTLGCVKLTDEANHTLHWQGVHVLFHTQKMGCSTHRASGMSGLWPG